MTQPGTNNYQTEKDLLELPDKIADSLVAWRTATLNREKADAVLFLRFKGGEEKRTSDEIKAMVRVDGGRYDLVLKEIMAESEYNRLNEKLMSAKKICSLRTAF